MARCGASGVRIVRCDSSQVARPSGTLGWSSLGLLIRSVHRDAPKGSRRISDATQWRRYPRVSLFVATSTAPLCTATPGAQVGAGRGSNPGRGGVGFPARGDARSARTSLCPDARDHHAARFDGVHCCLRNSRQAPYANGGSSLAFGCIGRPAGRDVADETRGRRAVTLSSPTRARSVGSCDRCIACDAWWASG